MVFDNLQNIFIVPVSILYKSIAVRYRPVRVADGPITARYRFIKNASWGTLILCHIYHNEYLKLPLLLFSAD